MSTKSYLSNIKLLIVSILILISAKSYAEVFDFSYQFAPDPTRPWTTATLTGQIVGERDGLDPDIVYVSRIIYATLSREGLPDYEYGPVWSDRINRIDRDGGDAYPFGPTVLNSFTYDTRARAVMSFSGLNNNFRVCPNGFTTNYGTDAPNYDCGFAADGSGGFGWTQVIASSLGGWVSAADGLAGESCGTGSGPDRGCRVTNIPPQLGNWSLTARGSADVVCDTPITQSEILEGLATGFTIDPNDPSQDTHPIFKAAAKENTRGFMNVEGGFSSMCDYDNHLVTLWIGGGNRFFDTAEERLERLAVLDSRLTNYNFYIDGELVTSEQIASEPEAFGFNPNLYRLFNISRDLATLFRGFIIKPFSLLPGVHTARLDLDFDGAPLSLSVNFEVIETNIDGDDIPGAIDNCPTVFNPDQTDANGDGFGDACLDPNIEVPADADVSPTAEIEEGVEISSGVTVEEGVEIGADSTLDADTSVGADTTVGSNTSLDKGTAVGSNSQIADNVDISKESTIGNNVTIGAGTIIGQGVVIGDNVTIGENCVIERDAIILSGAVVPSGTTIARGAIVSP